MITDELITQAIENAPKDQFGQTPIIEKIVSRLFPDNQDEVNEHLKISKLYRVSTYSSWKCGGTYKAICRR